MEDLSNEFVVVVKVSTIDEVIVTSVYVPPGTGSPINLKWTLNCLDCICGATRQKFLIGGDFNSKHICWGSQESDLRGEILLDWSTSHNIQILNQGERPTFDVFRNDKRFKSFIDVTFSSVLLLPSVVSWSVLERPTMSDHKYLFIELTGKLKAFTPTTMTYKIHAGHLHRFKADLAHKLDSYQKKLLCPANTTNEIDRKVEILTSSIQT